MPSIKVIDREGNSNSRYHNLWNCVGRSDIRIWTIKKGTPNIYYMITGENRLEKATNLETIDLFHEAGFTLIPPEEAKTNRTVVLRQIDAIYKGASEEELKEFITLEDEQTIIEEVIKIPTPSDSPMLKVRFFNNHMAETALRQGVKVFNQTLPPKAVQKSVNVRLTACSNCFSYEHLRAGCPNPHAVRCTKCAREGHSFRNCPADYEKCLNCHENHTTFAKECGKRKELLKKKTKEEIGKEANRAKDRHREHLEEERKRRGKKEKEIPWPSLPANVFATIFTALSSAIMLESRMKGSFKETYDDILDFNNIPRVKVPNKIIKQLVESQNPSKKKKGKSDHSTDEFSLGARGENNESVFGSAADLNIGDSIELEETEITTEASEGKEGSPVPSIYKSIKKRKRCQIPKKPAKGHQAEGLLTSDTCSTEEEKEYLPSVQIHKKMSKTLPAVPPEGLQPNTPPGAVSFHRCSFIQWEQPELKRLQKLKMIIYYPVTWKLKQREILYEFMDGKTYTHYTQEEGAEKISTKQLISECLNRGQNPELAISFCGLSLERWKHYFPKSEN